MEEKINMVTCNVCKRNKPVEEMKPMFHYVCSECWEDMIIGINGQEIDKDILY